MAGGGRAAGQGVDQVTLDGRVEGDLATHHRLQGLADLLGAGVLGQVATLIAYLTHAVGPVAAREAGVLKRWRATPLPRWGYLAGRLCATLVMALASGAVTVLVGVLAYHASVGPGAALGLLVALGVGALAWAAVGTAVSVPSVPVHDLAVLAAWAAGGLVAALRLFRWAPRAA